MKILRDESGQALVLMALLCFVCLLGLVGFAVDVGTFFHAKRAMQIAADSAAIAGAAELNYGDVQSAGQAAATQNGFTNGSNCAPAATSAPYCVTVAINNPPLNGPHTGSANYVEAIVSQNQQAFFLKLFNVFSTPVTARGVATLGSSGETCVYLLGSSGEDFDNSGAASITLDNCGLIDDSSGGNAFYNSGAFTMSASYIGVVGGAPNGGAESITPTPVTGVVPDSDPLAYLSQPSTTGCGAALSYSTAGNYTLNPGCYDGLSVSTATNLTFNAGLYVFNGPINISGAATLSGTGVTFYFNNSIAFNGAATLDFSAPTSPTNPYNGILFFESRSDPDALTLTGASSSNLQGIIYMPDGALDISGATSMQLYTPIVVKQLKNSAAISLTLLDYLQKNPSSPLAASTLVE